MTEFKCGPCDGTGREKRIDGVGGAWYETTCHQCRGKAVVLTMGEGSVYECARCGAPSGMYGCKNGDPNCMTRATKRDGRSAVLHIDGHAPGEPWAHEVKGCKACGTAVTYCLGAMPDCVNRSQVVPAAPPLPLPKLPADLHALAVEAQAKYEKFSAPASPTRTVTLDKDDERSLKFLYYEIDALNQLSPTSNWAEFFPILRKLLGR